MPAAEEKPGLARGKPARAALHLAEVGVRVDVHLHFAELQVAEAHQREDRAHRLHPLLHHIRRAHGLLERALPFGGVHLPAEVGVEVAVIVVRLERQLLAVLRDELGQVDRLVVVSGLGGGHQAGPRHVIADRFALRDREFRGHATRRSAVRTSPSCAPVRERKLLTTHTARSR